MALEKENEKSEKRSERKRKRERKEEVIVHGPQPVVVAGNSDKNEKKVDSLSQIISESDSEGKEQGLKLLKIFHHFTLEN